MSPPTAMTTTSRSTPRCDTVRRPSMAMPGIIGPASDPQVELRRVRPSAARRGAFVLDLGLFPRTLRLSLRDGVPSADGVDLLAVGSWYVRSLPLPLPFRVTHDSPTLVSSSGTTPRGGNGGRSWPVSWRHWPRPVPRWSTRPSGWRSTSASASSSTCCVPPVSRSRRRWPRTTRTLSSSSPGRSGSGGVQAARGRWPVPAADRCRPLDRAPASCSPAAPVLFQAEIPGTNIRVYVVGGRVAARIRDRLRRARLPRCGGRRAAGAARLGRG